MNTRLIASTLFALATAASASASFAATDAPLTREQVRAAAAQANAQGALRFSEIYTPATTVGASRDAVRTEALQAVRAGSSAVDEGGVARPAERRPTLSREQARAETLRATRAGEAHTGDAG